MITLESGKGKKKVQVWEKSKNVATLVYPKGNPLLCLPGGLRGFLQGHTGPGKAKEQHEATPRLWYQKALNLTHCSAVF